MNEIKCLFVKVLLLLKGIFYWKSMKEHILLHVCCGPCAIVPVLRLRDQGHSVTALFVNPNIHPLSEYLRRREALVECSEKLGFTVIFRDDMWHLPTWLSAVAGKKDSGAERCGYCYDTRLQATAQTLSHVHSATQAQVAQEGEQGNNATPFTAFSSSLLYSCYQDHAQIVDAAQKAAAMHSVRFYYDDFRDEWQKGIDISKEMGIYRQAYCGCIYSESERYAKKLQKLVQANAMA